MSGRFASTIRFDEDHSDDIVYPGAIPFALVHLACLGMLWSGITAASVALCVSLYVVRMFAITAGFHRYFSHRSFTTSRWFQFLLAFLSQTSLQRGVLWWAAKHRHHHRFSDTALDAHSPVAHGFFFAHVGWIFARQRGKADYSLVRDLEQFPELRWLDRFRHVPGILLAVTCVLVGGWPGLFVGFFLSTTLLFHGAFAINSLAHTMGRRRYLTGDDSRNSWWLALLTMGEGWHNNHHYYQSATRQGWRWWEIDVTYYVLRALASVGVVWDLTDPPAEVVAGERRLARPAIERAAWRLAASLAIERRAEQIRAAWADAPGLEELRAHGAAARGRLIAILEEVHRPHLPSLEEIERRAREIAPRTPSLDEIVRRAREIAVEAVCMRLLEPVPALA